MARLRLGVVLLVPPPVAHEVDGLRRACGDAALGRVPPHVTLVPPVNVREERLVEVVALLRAGAAETRPFTVGLGPAATFSPDAPVVYLAVEPDQQVCELRGRVFVEPLARDLTFPFVPHVTLADEMPAERIPHALSVLRHFRATATFERVHLLREGPDRVWSPIADAPFTAAAVVGRGGIELELSVSERLGPQAAALIPNEWARDEEPFAVTARRDGRVVGVAEGRFLVALVHLRNLFVAAPERGQGVGRQLMKEVESLAAARGAGVVVRTDAGSAAERFYRERGYVAEATWAWSAGRGFVQLRRRL